MAFIKRLWKDRISEFPNRRTVNDGYVTKQVTVGRDEGNITEAGDSFDAANMNDLEQRIEDCYGDIQALVGSEVAAQYNQDNVIFDPVATEGHGTGFVVSSDYIANLKASDLKDVNITSPTQGEALVFDNDGNLVNGTVSTVGNLDDLNDVDTTGKASGDSLRYDGNDWVAKPTTVEMTQAEWNAIADKTTWRNAHKNTHLVIKDAPNLNPTASDIEYSSGVTVKQAIDSKANISDVKELKSLSQSFTIAANSSITIEANSTRIMCLLFGVSDSQYVASVAYLIGGYVTASRCAVTNLSGLTGITINSSSTTDMKFVITNTQNFSVSFNIYNLIGSGFTQL